MDDQEWGPWREHDGKGCPCVGEYVGLIMEMELGEFEYCEAIAGSEGGESWDWSNYMRFADEGFLIARVVRYKIRKPKGMELVDKALNVRIPDHVDA